MCIKNTAFIDPTKDDDCGKNGTNPISAATGCKHQAETDFEISPALGLSLTRRYVSVGESLAWQGDSQFGRWWSSSLQRRIFIPPELSGDNTVAVQREGGGIVFFRNIGGEWKSDSDVHDTLNHIPLGLDGVVWVYRSSKNSMVAELYDETGNLVELRSGEAASVKFTYSSNFEFGIQKLNQAIDQSGRKWKFTYNDSNLIDEVELPDGGAIHYDYHPETGMLKSVTYPGGEARSYVYGEGEFGKFYQLTGIEDGDGGRFATWRYDPIGRAILSVHGDVDDYIDRAELEYYGSPLNHGYSVKIKKWGSVGYSEVRLNYSRTEYGVPKISGIDGFCYFCDGQNFSSITYNDRWERVTTTDFSGVRSRFSYDARGLVVRHVEAENIPPTIFSGRVTETDWHEVLRAPIERRVFDANNALFNQGAMVIQ